jgi:hypothetical protein
VGSLENLTNGGHNIYLTSRDDITSNPSWLDGTDINALGGADRTGAIIIVEKGDGVVDVFYFIFWAFNYGGQVLGQNLGMCWSEHLDYLHADAKSRESCGRLGTHHDPIQERQAQESVALTARKWRSIHV